MTTAVAPALAWLHDPAARAGRAWAGAVSVEVDGRRCAGHLVRAYRRDGAADPVARLRCELFLDGVEPTSLTRDDVRARLHTDLPAGIVPLRLRVDDGGQAEVCGNNVVFDSGGVPLPHTGAFGWRLEFQAVGAGGWVAQADLVDEPPIQVVVSPGWVADSPTVTEVCLRKVGARLDGTRFLSGRITEMTARLPQITTDVLYLLPFFLPGLRDAHTGKDVRKGELGSVYAVRDFFRLDPDLVTPAADSDLADLVDRGLLTDDDVVDLWQRLPGADGPPPTAAQLAAAGGAAAATNHGAERLTQLIGRAELRDLCRRAHALGKRVIFDLVLMQTSRDCPLIDDHPEWYALDESGRPKIHQIAWLVYSDVALFDLQGNRPLQDYLLEVAPYWMARCELDGVRIDASQTVDRDFLRRLKNRIQQTQPEALVLGETLCALREAVDIPVDMVYALMVDFHRDVEQATPLIDFLEQVHGTFAGGTVAMAYFENHDSPRATQIWEERYANALEGDRGLARAWRRRLERDGASGWMALLKNLQATLIDGTAGMWPGPAPGEVAGRRPQLSGGTQLAWAIEWGSEWGERARTDFENPTLLHVTERDSGAGAHLVRAYQRLAEALPAWPELRRGQVWYHRNSGPHGDADDRVLAYTRYTESSAVVVVHNLDIQRTRWVTIPQDWLPWSATRPEPLFDSYAALGLQEPAEIPEPDRHGLRIGVGPLQTRLVRLRRDAPIPRKD